MSLLHVYAVNVDLGDLSHTNLTRVQETGPVDLPPLADWLGVAVDVNAVELFAVRDLKPLRLTDYLRDGCEVEEKTLSPHASRLAALEGHVLLVPDDALSGEPSTSAELTAIATLPTVRANQSQSAVPKMPEPAQTVPDLGTGDKKPMSDARMSGMVAMVALAVLFGLVLVMVLIS